MTWSNNEKILSSILCRDWITLLLFCKGTRSVRLVHPPQAIESKMVPRRSCYFLWGSDGQLMGMWWGLWSGLLLGGFSHHFNPGVLFDFPRSFIILEEISRQRETTTESDWTQVRACIMDYIGALSFLLFLCHYPSTDGSPAALFKVTHSLLGKDNESPGHLQGCCEEYCIWWIKYWGSPDARDLVLQA